MVRSRVDVLYSAGIGRIAQELGVDAAGAVTGWEFNSGCFARPVQDGWVVPTCSVSCLMDAWAEKQAEKRRREQLKQTERCAARWERLVRGLMIRSRLLTKYGGSAASSSVP